MYISKDHERRLQEVLESARNGAEIIVWQHKPLKLHEVLNIDYVTVAKARNTMRKL